MFQTLAGSLSDGFLPENGLLKRITEKQSESAKERKNYDLQKSIFHTDSIILTAKSDTGR